MELSKNGTGTLNIYAAYRDLGFGNMSSAGQTQSQVIASSVWPQLAGTCMRVRLATDASWYASGHSQTCDDLRLRLVRS